jgi:hypothetical protein
MIKLAVLAAGVRAEQRTAEYRIGTKKRGLHPFFFKVNLCCRLFVVTRQAD